MRTALLMIALLLAAAAAQAQISTFTLAWDYIGATPGQVSGWTQTVLIDAAVQAGAPSCAAKTVAPVGVTCTLTMPKPASGPHTLTVRSVQGATTAEGSLVGYDPSTAPVAATGIRTTVTITVTVP